MSAAMLGIDDGLTRAIASGGLSGRFALSLGVRWAALIGLPTSFAIWAFQDRVTLHGNYWLDAVLISALALPYIVLAAATGVLNGLGRIVAWNFACGVGGVVYAGSVVILFAWHHITIRTVVLSWVLAHVVACSTALWLTLRRTSRIESDSSGAGAARDLFRFGSKVTVAKFSSQLNQRLDQAVLAVFVGGGALGGYAVAATISLSPGLLLNAYASYAFGVIGRIPSERDHVAKRYIWRSVLLSAVIYGTVIAVSPALLRYVFGSEYADQLGITITLCLGSLCLFGSQVASAVLNAYDHAGTPAFAQVVGLVITVSGLVLLVRPYGTWGAAVTSLAAYFAYASIVSVAAWRLLWRTGSHDRL